MFSASGKREKLVPLMAVEKGTKLQEWIAQLEKELEDFSTEKEQYPNDESSPIFLRVPKVLLDSSHKSYVPCLVSIGPYHFGKDDLSSMERHKSEAVFRMQKRIQRRCPNITMKSIVEKDIVGKENRVRKCYVDKIPYNSNVLAWILTRDACFTLEMILNVIRVSQEESSQEELENYHPVFNASILDPIWHNIASDLILLENQIPLFILEHLIEIQTGSETAAGEMIQYMLSYMSKFYVYSIFAWEEPRYEKGKSCHLLDAVYYRNVGLNPELYYEESYAYERGRFFSVVRAVELVKAGVKFKAVTWKDGMPGAPIRWVRFDEKTSTLYLPEVRLDEHRHILMRNFIALEITSNKYRPRPFTYYAMFMNELIDSKEDVDLLTGVGIIKNSLGSNGEVAHYFNWLTKGILPMSGGCRSIENARGGLEKYMKRRIKILWNQFMSAYFSKPWLVAGSVGATLLLFMTVLQVFCLFYTCNPKA